MNVGEIPDFIQDNLLVSGAVAAVIVTAVFLLLRRLFRSDTVDMSAGSGGSWNKNVDSEPSGWFGGKRARKKPRAGPKADDSKPDMDKMGRDLVRSARSGEMKEVKSLLAQAGKVRRGWGGETELILACSFGELGPVAFLLDSGADVHGTDNMGATALMETTRHVNADIARLLLERGAEINAVDNQNRMSALMIAAMVGRDELIGVLLEAGAEINAKDKFGRSALRLAASQLNPTTVELLLKAGADIDARDEGGQTALMNCIYPASNMESFGYDMNRAAEVLVNAGADVSLRDNEGRTALDLAREEENEVIERLLEKAMSGGASSSQRNERLMAGDLLSAVETGDTQVVASLLERGANLNALHEGNSALSAASTNDDEEMVRFLVRNGADVNVRGEGGNTPLIAAAGHGNCRGIEVLLEEGADVDAVNDLKQSALMMAAYVGQEEAIDLLLNKGSDVDTQDQNGFTPLLMAAYQGFFPVMELLLLARAKLEFRTSEGQTALMMATNHDDAAGVKMLLEAGDDIDARDHSGNTALRFAAFYGREDVVLALLQKRADISIRDDEDKTALDWALEEGHGNIVKLIRGQDPDN